MLKIKRIFISILLLSISAIVSAQDIHFSQFFQNPLHTNPAQSGYFDASHRFAINHRSQWSSVTVPFNTISASYDFNFLKSRRIKSMMGGGIFVSSDKAGDSQFGTTQANFSLSYIFSPYQLQDHYFSIAAMGGMAQRSINYSELVFDSQFNGEYYDADLYNGETFDLNNFTFQDFSGGLQWFWIPSKGLNVHAGFSVYHLNQPDQSLFTTKDIPLPMKFNFNAGAYFEINGAVSILPSLLISQQGTFNEVIIGGRYRIEKLRNRLGANGVEYGLFMRSRDAAITYFGLIYDKMNIGISYDVNYSTLRPASQFRGGYEVSLIYRVENRKRSKKYKKIPCSDF